MEGQSGVTGLQLNVISFRPKLTRAKEISSGGGNGTAFYAFGISMNKNIIIVIYNSYHIRMSSVVLKIPIRFCDPLLLAHSMTLPIKSELRMTLS